MLPSRLLRPRQTSEETLPQTRPVWPPDPRSLRVPWTLLSSDHLTGAKFSAAPRFLSASFTLAERRRPGPARAG